MLGVNAAGIKSKLESFEFVLDKLKPQIWAIQETKLKRKETIKVESIERKYQVYYLSRNETIGGGVAVGIDKEIESTLVREGNDDVEVLVVEINLNVISIRVVVGYAPQENALVEKKDIFWKFIEEEVVKAEINQQGFILQMDGNLHGGPEIIKGDPNTQNRNGKLFQEFLERNKSLTVANNLDICEGLITRCRVLENRTERAVLDLLVVNEILLPFLSKMLIDEDRNHCLRNFSGLIKNKGVTETDHNLLIAEFQISVPKRKQERQLMFNLRNTERQELFKYETDNNYDLVRCFESEMPFESQCDQWFRIFNSILHKCFKKVRIVNNSKKSDKTRQLLQDYHTLKTKKSHQEDDGLKENLSKLDKEIFEEITRNFVQEVSEVIKSLGGDQSQLNGSGRAQVWQIIKQKFPKIDRPLPVGKLDRFGNLVTNHAGLKSLYLNTYKQRLRNRPIKDELIGIKALKDISFQLKLEVASSNKSAPWTIDDLESVLKKLKTGKSRDPHGWVNDIFRNEVAGCHLKLSMLTLFNKVKSENKIPDFMRLADISAIYKGKGQKISLENDRGIFLVTIFRSILMRLVYKDTYDVINENMSDSQVGGRKGKNVRTHIWIINGIICDVLSSKKKHPVDLQLFDYRQCFDSLWLDECLSDLFNSGVRDDKLALLHNINSHVKIAIKTPIGKTDTEDIYNVITQGDVFGPLLCSNLVDNIGKECIIENKYLYSYKGVVEVPTLGMVDDLICDEFLCEH